MEQDQQDYLNDPMLWDMTAINDCNNWFFDFTPLYVVDKTNQKY